MNVDYVQNNRVDHTDIAKICNERAQAGWTLVAVLPFGGSYYMCEATLVFKRNV